MIDYERELQNISTESKIIEFHFDFAEKLNIKVWRDFQKLESRFWGKLIKIELKFLI